MGLPKPPISFGYFLRRNQKYKKMTAGCIVIEKEYGEGLFEKAKMMIGVLIGS